MRRRASIAIVGLLAVAAVVAGAASGDEPGLFRPTADASPFSGPRPTRVRFTASAGFIPGPVRYHWCFDDGTVSEEQSPRHVFRRSGYYIVQVDIVGERPEYRATRSLYLGAWPRKTWRRAQKGLDGKAIKRNIRRQTKRTRERRRALRRRERRTGKPSPATKHPCGRLDRYGPTAPSSGGTGPTVPTQSLAR